MKPKKITVIRIENAPQAFLNRDLKFEDEEVQILLTMMCDMGYFPKIIVIKME